MATNPTTQLRLFAADSTPAAAHLIGVDSLAGQQTIEQVPAWFQQPGLCPGSGTAGEIVRTMRQCLDCDLKSLRQIGHVPAHVARFDR